MVFLLNSVKLRYFLTSCIKMTRGYSLCDVRIEYSSNRASPDLESDSISESESVLNPDLILGSDPYPGGLRFKRCGIGLRFHFLGQHPVQTS